MVMSFKTKLSKTLRTHSALQPLCALIGSALLWPRRNIAGIFPKIDSRGTAEFVLTNEGKRVKEVYTYPGKVRGAECHLHSKDVWILRGSVRLVYFNEKGIITECFLLTKKIYSEVKPFKIPAKQNHAFCFDVSCTLQESWRGLFLAWFPKCLRKYREPNGYNYLASDLIR